MRRKRKRRNRRRERWGGAGKTATALARHWQLSAVGARKVLRERKLILLCSQFYLPFLFLPLPGTTCSCLALTQTEPPNARWPRTTFLYFLILRIRKHVHITCVGIYVCFSRVYSCFTPRFQFLSLFKRASVTNREHGRYKRYTILTNRSFFLYARFSFSL